MSFQKINSLASARIPFLVITDFKAEKIEVFTLDELKKENIEFSFNSSVKAKLKTKLATDPIPLNVYKEKFDQVIEQIKNGNTYLFNLTQPTPITTSHSLKEIYNNSSAPFKLLYKDKFVCFSPEKFIDINNSTISTYPMKGTIDASVENAKEKILADQKEMAEHVMITDLLRNDLGIVAKNIKVDSFRYVEKIDAGDKELLQVSSKISGKLPDNWRENFGDILSSLLPAGSISGTPKKKTVELIESIENYDRNYFTGVFGYFDGKSFKSAVMIRFIQKYNNSLVYKSGGGITIDSNAKNEYREMLEKVYI
ncbi:MAG: aminodeoxychorismate synthase component I [Helicobacteraceae bacterium]|nr:aminodeoxychorismate synthase component I [Helicobacteraceae bacterium]